MVELSSAEADLPFLEMILEEEQRRGAPMPLDALIVLSRLREEKRLDGKALAVAVQKDAAAARAVAERLVEAGLLQALGRTRARVYTLSPQVYRKLGQKAESVRQAGFDEIQQLAMIRNFVRQHGQIRRQEVVELCGASPDQAKRLLGKLVREGVLEKAGEKRATIYRSAGGHST